MLDTNECPTAFSCWPHVLIAVQLEEEEKQQLCAAFPSVEFFFSGREIDETIAAISEVIFCRHITPEIISVAPYVHWVHIPTAGADHLPLAYLAKRGIILTNSRGIHGIPVAENILAMMLAFATRLPTFVRAQISHTWQSDHASKEKFELEGQTLLVIGLGDLGMTLARKARALGMSVIGYRRQQLPVEGVEALIHPGDLHAALAQSDHVALCLPLTQETKGFFGEPELRSMKSTAYLYNVGRGSCIAREPLLCALQEGWIAGAGLDVTDPEPLPPDDLLWERPNVLLTQHTGGYIPESNSRRIAQTFADNLQRYLAGEPLMNVVDSTMGY